MKTIERRSAPTIGEERRATFIVKEMPAGRRAVMSSPKVDRVGDVIVQDGWVLDAFRSNPVMLYEHMRDAPVGIWRDVKIENGMLTGEPVWHPEGINPLADRLRALYEIGHLKAFSVGFRVLEFDPAPDGSGWLIKRAELFECSAVTIPANTDALLKAAPGVRMLPIAGKYGGLDALLAKRDPAGICNWLANATRLQEDRGDMTETIKAFLADPVALAALKTALGSMTDSKQPEAQTTDDASADGAATGEEDEDLVAVEIAETEAEAAELESLIAEIEDETGTEETA